MGIDMCICRACRACRAGELESVPVLGQALIGESGADAADDLGLELAHPKVLGEIAVPHQQLVEDHTERIHV
jgi:hypothetical protein